jgi:hypothetical protein
MMKKAFFYMKEAAFKKKKIKAHSMKRLKRLKRRKYLMIK